MSRLIIEITGKLLFTTVLEVRISDINYGNHTGNDRIAAFLHEARVQWLKSLGFTELNIEGTGVIMSDLSIQYLRESFYGDRLSISIHSGETGRSSFELFYNISIDQKPEAIIARAKTGMLCYNYERKKVAAIPDVLTGILQ
jgi:acyl-CoA thioesterase FadM